MTITLSPAPLRQRLLGWLKDEFAPQSIVTSINAALILYLLEFIITLSFTALIFSGKLTAQLPYALSFILIGNAALVAVVTLLSSYGGSMAVAQDTPGAILALAVASLIAALPANITTEQLFATVVVLLVGMTVVTGLVYLALGVLKWGGLVRFLPYPVIGGFLAGTGWLLTMGGMSVATDSPFGMGLLQPAMLSRWLPAALLGLIMLLAVRRWRNPLVLVGLFVLGLVVFYAVMAFLGIPLATLSAEGWLLGPFPADLAWRFPVDALTFAQVDWRAIFNALPIAAPAILISIIAFLLNASSLELLVKQDIDLNRELVAMGAANVVAGLLGGLIGYTAISFSALNHVFGKGKRLPGIVVALLLVITIFAGASLLSFMPRLLLGALLIYIGLALLYEWVIQTWFVFPKPDYAIIVSILAVIVLKDFLWGIGVGLILTINLFVINYSRISSIRHELTGATYRSRVSRSVREWELLQAHGTQLLIFKLQGWIFFGTANSLFDHLRECARHPSDTPVRYILLDFEHVSGFDSTGRLSFNKLLQFTATHHIKLIMTGLSPRLRAQFQKAGFTEQTEGLHLLPNIDRGVEWAEDQIIASLLPSIELTSLQDHLLTILPDPVPIAALIQAMRPRDVAAGEYIIRQGDEPDQLFFVASGQLTVQLEKPGRPPVRLETMRGGRMVGELGFFLGTRRNASVVADRPSVVYALSLEDWGHIQKKQPEVAQTVHSLAIHLLGQRVSFLTRVMDTLQY